MPLTPESEPPTPSERSTTVVVGAVDDIGEGEMKMVKVGERRVAVIRTASGVHAIDNACPHQGYGLVTGALDDELVTCQWHNWKFRVDTGECVMGEEDVPCHAVTIEDGTIHVTVDEPTAAEERERLWPSLRRGIEDNYVGQVARDSIRLLANDAMPEAIAWVGFEHALPREEWGVGHAMATAVDCLAWTVERDGDDRALPLVQALAALAEPTRGRPARRRRDPRAGDLIEAIEGEDHDAAMGIARRLAAEADPAEVRRRFIEAASMHHLSYGHGIIYTQKAFELLDLVGWDKADLVLHELALATTWGTREDTLPYMRKTVAEVRALDLEAIASTPVDPEWDHPGLVDAMLEIDDAPIAAAVEALAAGAGVERLLDAVTIAVSRRLLRYDLDIEFDLDESFGWLDITHGLTTARAARWAWRAHPSPATIRQALWAVWLCHDTSRGEQRHGVRPDPEIVGTPGDITGLIRQGDVDGALAAIRAAGLDACSSMIEAALADSAGSFIVTAHLIKLTKAAIEEAETTGSDLPLLAAGRYLASPRLERFVSRNVIESLDFVKTGRPPTR